MNNGIVFLQSKAAITANVLTNFTQATHPTSGLVRGYLLRILFTAQSATSDTPATLEEWKHTLLEGGFDIIQLLAPRYNNALCTANLTAGYWAKLYEDLYGAPMPIVVGGVQVTPETSPAITFAAAADCEVDLFIPFERPKLGPDRTLSCPPASLFAGDVNLNFRWQTAAGTVQAKAITFGSVTVNWYADIVRGNNARVPLIHRFERKTYSSDSIDIGRGWPFFITDNVAPDDTVRYDVLLDGENINQQSATGLDMEAAYRIENTSQVAENRDYTPVMWMADNATINELHLAARSVALKFYGKSSGTLDLHFADPPGPSVQTALQVALGLPANAAASTPPETPKTAELGNVERNRAVAGPRNLHLKVGANQVSPSQATRTVPTVPGGTLGAGMASAANRK